MTYKNNSLWNKLQAFEFDDPESPLTFTDRLARENGWTIDFAIRATEEYKRFIYLLCIADHPLTPSDQVDQVWHLHLLYTVSYWIDLCRETIERQIHHGPTKGGQQENDKYHDLYGKTIAFYTQVFGETPPSDIWPSAKIRFSDINFQRVNIGRNWVVKKPTFFFS